MSDDSVLFSPFKLGSIEVKNRMAMAPLTRARAGEDRIPNDLMSQYYVQRASAGLIISEATTISAQGNGWNHSPGIYTDQMEAGWKQVVDDVHRAGGKIVCQLWHTGRASHSDFHDGELPVAPSPIKINDGEQIRTPNGKQDREVPRPLKLEELPGVVEDYLSAASRASSAGFDGVEIHSANGYLLDSFLQSISNQREDQYGGSLANRYELLREVVEAVTSVWPAGKVGVRISPNGAFNGMGSPDFREQFMFVASQLNQFELAYLHVMDGLGFGFHELGDPMTLAEFRAVFDGPLMGNVGYTQETATSCIAAGDADAIAFGRPYISNPDLVERFKNDWPLNPEADTSVWYEDLGAKGYTDFPAYQESAIKSE